MKIVVSGVGIVTALGIGAGDNIASITKGKSGLSLSPRILKTNNLLPVGELRMTNEQLHEITGIPVSRHLSRTALLGILAVREAMADAKIDFAKRVALVSSTSVGGMDLTEHFFEDFIKNDSKGRLRDVRMHDCHSITEAIMYYCGINGYSTTISTACSSSANAVMAGAKLLEHNIADYVIVGGCDALSAFTLNGFKSLMIIDKNFCRPFDENRAGLNLGEGAGFLVLQREEQTGNFYCYLRGYANRNDINHQTASSANGNGAYLAMKSALKKACISPELVDYINVHGTGTQNNDASESAAMIRLFGGKIPSFSSTKGFIGHTLAAAGGIEAVLSVLSVKYGYIYPNLNFATPISGFGLVPQTEFRKDKNIHCVLTNSFGFGGNCSTLVFGK